MPIHFVECLVEKRTVDGELRRKAFLESREARLILGQVGSGGDEIDARHIVDERFPETIVNNAAGSGNNQLPQAVPDRSFQILASVEDGKRKHPPPQEAEQSNREKPEEAERHPIERPLYLRRIRLGRCQNRIVDLTRVGILYEIAFFPKHRLAELKILFLTQAIQIRLGTPDSIIHCEENYHADDRQRPCAFRHMENSEAGSPSDQILEDDRPEGPENREGSIEEKSEAAMVHQEPARGEARAVCHGDHPERERADLTGEKEIIEDGERQRHEKRSLEAEHQHPGHYGADDDKGRPRKREKDIQKRALEYQECGEKDKFEQENFHDPITRLMTNT